MFIPLIVMMRLKSIFFTACMGVAVLTSTALASEQWLKSIPVAQELSQKHGKPVFVEFTGSDWCPPCIMMHKNVFSKEKFLEEAQKHFILVKIDIPQSDPKLSDKNQKVLEQYNVTGVPTVLLLDSKGKEFARFGASQHNTVEKMLAELERQLRIKDML